MKRYLLTLLLLAAAVITGSGQIRFSADFESGAVGEVVHLDSATFVMMQEDTVSLHSFVVKGSFDPKNPIDTSLASSPRWFYFQVSGVKDKLVYFNFEDTDPVRPLYSYDNVTWERFAPCEASFRKVSKRFERDTVYLAYFQPYTYSYLQSRVEDWSRHQWVDVDTIGLSLENRPIYMMHITDESVPPESKQRLWLHARQHPSESPASWLTDGFISALVADTPTGAALRKQIDAYIIPQTNPDGVANGLSRSNITGVNQEINFARPDDSTVVEVKAIKEVIRTLSQERPFDVALNVHSQVAHHASYWLHRAAGTSKDFLRRELVLADLTTSLNDYIRPEDMQFSNLAARYPEGWFWSLAGEKTLAVTFETSYTCYSRDFNGTWLDTLNLRDFGERLLMATAEYMTLSLPGRAIILPPAEASSRWEAVSVEELTYMGDVAWKAVRPNAKIRYTAEVLEAGEYDIYMYISAPNDESQSKGERGWKQIGTHIQKETGKLKYNYKISEVGGVAGALLFIKTN